MSSTREAAQGGGAGRRWLSARWTAPVAAGILVFLLNNLLLARLLTSLPGGTVLAPTTMAAVAIVTLWVRRPGVVTILFATYGVLGVLGHLGVDAGRYLLHLPHVLGAALVFDVVLAAGRFRWWALATALLPFAAAALAGVGLPLRGWLVALLLGWAGLAAGVLLFRGARRQAAGPAPGSRNGSGG